TQRNRTGNRNAAPWLRSPGWRFERRSSSRSARAWGRRSSAQADGTRDGDSAPRAITVRGTRGEEARMELTLREFWTVVHGMGLGALFLLAFAGGLAGLWSLRSELVTAGGVRERLPRLEVGTWVMAIVAWLTVVSGTYLV